MKPVVVFVATFLAATAASAGAKVVMTKPAPAHGKGADSLAVSDSTHAGSNAAEAKPAGGSAASAAPKEAPADSTKRPAPAVKADNAAPSPTQTTAALSPAAKAGADSATARSGAGRRC